MVDLKLNFNKKYRIPDSDWYIFTSHLVFNEISDYVSTENFFQVLSSTNFF